MMMTAKAAKTPSLDGETFINRELSWLQFARRVLELARDPEVPLLEQVKYAGILGMLHDEFFMKRMSGLKRQIQRGVKKISLDGRSPQEEYDACREEIVAQVEELAELSEIRSARRLGRSAFPILDHGELPTELQRNSGLPQESGPADPDAIGG